MNYEVAHVDLICLSRQDHNCHFYNKELLPAVVQLSADVFAKICKYNCATCKLLFSNCSLSCDFTNDVSKQIAIIN